MPRLVTYRCPDCGGEFDFLHHPSDEPPPAHCDLCGSDMGDEPPKAPVIHLNLGTKKNKIPDEVYRRMESASEGRAKDAADMLGCSVSEVSAIKMTDMKDNMREGDVAAVAPVAAEARIRRYNEAMTQLSHINGQKTGSIPAMQGINQEQANGYRGEIATGPEAMKTANMIKDMRRSGAMQRILDASTRNGLMNKS